MAAGSSSAISDGAFAECTSDDLQPADIDGAEFALFEFDAGGTFSAAPTTSGTVNIYEQTINSDGNDAPDVTPTTNMTLLVRLPSIRLTLLNTKPEYSESIYTAANTG